MEFIYVITNPIFPPNHFYIEFTIQNETQLSKRFNRYYLENISITHCYLSLSNKRSQILNNLNKYLISNNFYHIDATIYSVLSYWHLQCLNQYIFDHQSIISKVNLCFQDLCISKPNSSIKVNTLFDFFSQQSPNLSYLDFSLILSHVYHLSLQNNYILNTDWKYHKDNIYHEYSQLLLSSPFSVEKAPKGVASPTEPIYTTPSNLKFKDLNISFRKWLLHKHPYYPLPHKSIRRKFLLSLMNQKYPNLSLPSTNPHSTRPYKISWNHVSLQHY